MRKILNLMGTTQATVAGYLATSPNSDIWNGMHNMLLQVVPDVPSADTGQIIKLLAGLLIGILSKWIYAMIDKKYSKNKKEEDE